MSRWCEYPNEWEEVLEFENKHELTHDEAVNKLLDTYEEKEQKK